MKKIISLFLVLSTLALNAMESMDTSGYLETPAEIVENLVEAKNTRGKDDTLPKELFGIVSATLTGEKPAKIAECLKILHSFGNPKLFDSVVSYFVQQAIQCRQDKSTFDKWFKQENEQKILEFLKHEFDRQKEYQLAEIFKKSPNLPIPEHNLRSHINSDCLSDEMKSVLYAGDHSKYIKTLNSKYCVNGISPNNKYIATYSYKNGVEIWNTDNDSLIATLGDRLIEWVVFSPDNKLVVTGSQAQTAKLWDLNGHCLATLTDHARRITCAAFSPDGNYLVTGSWDNTAIIWDITDIKKIKRVAILRDKKEMCKVAFSPDSKHVITLASNLLTSSIKRWDLQGNCTAQSTYSKHINCIDISPDGTTLVIGSSNDNIQLLNANNLELINVLTGHSSGSVCRTIISPDGQYIASHSQGMKPRVCIHDIKGKLVSILLLDSAPHTALTFSENQHVTIFQSTENAKVWDWQQQHIDITQEINNLTLEQLMLLNHLDGLIKAGAEAAPESTKEATKTLPPLIRNNIENAFNPPSQSYSGWNSKLECTLSSSGAQFYKPQYHFNFWEPL